MAEEDFGTGATAPEAPDPVQQVKDDALASMAKDENPANYIAEREARDKEAKGEEVAGDDRAARIREALAKARQDTAEARNGFERQPDLDAEFQNAEQQWQQAEQQEATFETERELARQEGKFQAVAEGLRQSDPQTWQKITDNLAVFDEVATPEQGDALKRALTAGDPREGLAIVHRLAQDTYNSDGTIAMTAADKVLHIASLPPQEIARIVSQARDWLQIEHNISQRYAAAYAAQGRRHTRAPEPFRAPKGGASPPQNLNALASKGESPKDYIRARQQQMRKPRDE
jgi:hypothetical protein